MWCVWISEQTATFALCNINRFVLYNRSGEFTARYGLSPYIKVTFGLWRFKGANYKMWAISSPSVSRDKADQLPVTLFSPPFYPQKFRLNCAFQVKYWQKIAPNWTSLRVNTRVQKPRHAIVHFTFYKLDWPCFETILRINKQVRPQHSLGRQREGHIEMTNRSDLPDARGILAKRRALEALGSEVQ